MSMTTPNDRGVFYCEKCGAFNRVPTEKIALGPRCGRCHTALDTSGKPVVVTDQSFESVIRASPVPVLLDVWAPWCGPCRMVAPVLEQVGKGHAGRLLIAKLNSDENPQVAGALKVRSIPTLVVFKGGQPVQTTVGALPKAQIEALVGPYL